MHKVVHHEARPERFYLENHGGLYRSDDWGDRWEDIVDGVPSDFGFAMAIHPADLETVYILPLDGEGRRPVGVKLQVHRTQDGGASWEGLGNGLPQEDAYETTLRDGMDTDTLDPARIYFGTRSGKIYGSSDEGETWTLIKDGLPPVVCMKAAVLP